MRDFSEISSKKYLIWLVSLTLFFSFSSGNSESVSSAPLKHLRQTELTLSDGVHKSTRNLPIDFSGTQAIQPDISIGTFSFRYYIDGYTQSISLIVKKCNAHFIPFSPKGGILHGNIPADEDEHSFPVKG